MLIRHLPDDAAVRAVDRDGPLWTLTDHLLDDVRIRLDQLLGAEAKDLKLHPQRPDAPKSIDPIRQKKLDDARNRLRERDRAIAAGEIT